MNKNILSDLTFTEAAQLDIFTNIEALDGIEIKEKLTGNIILRTKNWNHGKKGYFSLKGTG